MSWSSPTTLGSASGTTSATSQSLSGITASAGSFVVVAGSIHVGSAVTGATVSDSAGNSWTVHAEANPSTLNGYGFIAYAILTTALSSGSITVTRAGSGNITAFCMGAVSFTGNAASSPEDTAVLAAASGTSNSPAVTGNAGGGSGDLLIACCAYIPGTTTYTEDTADSWTNIFNLQASSTTAGLGLAYQVNSGTSGIKHNPSLSNNMKWAELQVAFKAGAATLALAAQSLGMGVGKTAGGFAASIAAKAPAFARGNASSSASAAISARAAARARSSGAVRYASALAARVQAAAAGKANAGSRTALLAKALAASRASALLSSGTRIAATAHAFGASFGSARLGAASSLVARATGQGAARARAAFGLRFLARGLAALWGRLILSQPQQQLVFDPVYLVTPPLFAYIASASPAAYRASAPASAYIASP